MIGVDEAVVMVKTFRADGWDFDAPVSELVKVSSRGLIGEDRREFLKRASSIFLKDIDEIDPKDGEKLAHAIALGAWEGYGNNRNGDGFVEEVCRSRHPTFVKHARCYRNHKNKDKSKSYGRIIKSAYNEDMKRIELLIAYNATKEAAERNGGLIADKELEALQSKNAMDGSMACVLQGTLIRTRKGFKKVENITLQDEVLTHKGRFRPVQAVMRRRRNQYVRMTLRGSGKRPLLLTPDHPLYALSWSRVDKLVKYVKAGLQDGPHPQRYAVRGFESKYAEWVPCGELKPSDLLFMPFPSECGTSGLSTELSFLLGAYIGGGIRLCKGNIIYVCTDDELFASKVLDAVRKCDPNASTFANGAYNGLRDEVGTVGAVSPILALQIKELTSRKRSVPVALYDSCLEAVEAFWLGWFLPFGHQTTNNIVWPAASHQLATDLRILFASQGLITTISSKNDDMISVPRSFKAVMKLPNIYSSRFESILHGRVTNINSDVRARSSSLSDRYLAVPIHTLNFIEEEVDVYDLTIADDHSFTAEGFIVKNCTVSHDICTACGNKARNRSEYCDDVMCKAGGCKSNLGKVVKLGNDIHHLGVLNPDPVWFDWSNVFRRADRIATTHLADWMNKEAADSAGADPIIPRNITVPPDTASRITYPSSMYASDAESMLKLMMAVAILEGGLRANSASFRAFDRGGSPKIEPDEGVGKNEALAALADKKAVLPIEDYGSMMNKSSFEIESAKSMLPGIYSNSMDSGDIEAKIHQVGNYLPDAVSNRAKMWAQKYAGEYSLDKDAVVNRCHRSVLQGRSEPVTLEKSASIYGPGRELAIDYAVYQLAALSRISEFDNQFPLTVKFAMLQNMVR